MTIPLALNIITSLVACSVAVIACLQLSTNRQKLRLDLYNRRFDIYVKTIEFYQALSSYDPLNKNEFLEIRKRFSRAVKESQFLFDDASGIFLKLDELHATSFKVSGFKEKGGTVLNAGGHKEFLEMSMAADSVLMQFSKEISILEKAFKKYLNFHKAAG